MTQPGVYIMQTKVVGRGLQWPPGTKLWRKLHQKRVKKRLKDDFFGIINKKCTKVMYEPIRYVHIYCDLGTETDNRFYPPWILLNSSFSRVISDANLADVGA